MTNSPNQLPDQPQNPGALPQTPAAHQKAGGEPITKEEWRKTHRDFKTTIFGVRYVLRGSPRGTVLVPVQIIK